ncbi:MAG: pyridoxal-dependent decarboxylase [Robiginitomaculum sp.]|nr:pyridoxal-dependent decarboxylase [Robiginitomaculum sp.]MDQ7078132.1 pyridoxal-dependent decarboxylase [Robiginitomaculum sp.]
MTQHDDKPFAADAYFLGPKSENGPWVRGEFQAILDHWFDWRRSLFADDPEAISEARRLSPAFLHEREVLGQELRNLLDMLRSEVPKFTPRYIGHMVSELSLPALFGHFATLLHNPNNTSREVARVGARMESEAIAMLGKMVGYDPKLAQGHFTSGGTMANFEAVWRARYRMDHGLSLGLVLAERDGDELDPFASAHMGWRAFEQIQKERGVDEETLRAASMVLDNPFEVARRIGKCTGRDYLGPVLITPGNKHFSWQKAANLFGLGEDSFWNTPLDAYGRVDLQALAGRIDEARDAGRPVLCLTSVTGTTEAGEIDPVDRVADMLDQLKEEGIHIWHHVDAAYGGFFCTLLGGPDEEVLAPEQRSALRAISRSQSVTIDPHKLGYVPYSCGAFVCRDEHAYRASSFQAPYIDRADTKDKWRCTLEGSRSGAGAAATWLTGKTLGFGHKKFGKIMAAGIEARQTFQGVLARANPLVRPLEPADTNILCFSLAKPGETLSQSNARTLAVYTKFQQNPDFSVSKTVLGAASYEALIDRHVKGYGGVRDEDSLALLRLVFMNPFWSSDEARNTLIPEFIALLGEFTA